MFLKTTESYAPVCRSVDIPIFSNGCINNGLKWIVRQGK